MKRFILFSLMAAALPLSMMAQDDVYFIPSKQSVKNVEVQVDDSPTYYSGIGKNDYEYNRRANLQGFYKKIGRDSLGNDIVEYRTNDGMSRIDTIYQFDRYYENNSDDFAYSRRMGRFDDFYGYRNYWDYGYPAVGVYASVGYWSPWYDDFYDPWYYGYRGYYGWGSYYGYGGYYGWYNPWRYNYGWGYPYYGYGYPYYGYGYPYYGNRYYGYYNGHTGTGNHFGRNNNYSGQTYRNNSNRVFGNMNQRSSRFGNNNSNYNSRNTYNNSRFGNQNSRFGNQQSRFGNQQRQSQFNDYDRGNTRSYNSSSFGSGSRSGGGSFGGGSRSGGGSFGGGSRGGGGSFGGHR